MKKHSRALILVLAVGVAVACPSAGFSQSAKSPDVKLFDEGREYQRDGNYVEAEKKFREALQKYPKAEQADRTAFYLIDTLVKLRRVTDARAEIDNFRRNYPGSKWLEDVGERILALERL